MIPEGSSAVALHQMLVIGVVVFTCLYVGKWVKHIKLPSLIGYMFVGVIAGPYVSNALGKELLVHLDYHNKTMKNHNRILWFG